MHSRDHRQLPGFIIWMLLIGVAIGIASCTPARYAAWADRDAYRTLKRGQAEALGNLSEFDIRYDPVKSDDLLNKEDKTTDETCPVITISDALQIAVRNSRDYQTRKERLFSAAMDLANFSRQWDTGLLSGDIDGTGDWTRTKEGSSGGGTDFGNKEITADAGLSLSRRLVGGGLLTLGATVDFVTSFLGGNSTQIGSMIDMNFTQPLLQGAWRDLAYEDQYRLNRDFLFEVFQFARFRQTFASDIVSDYYDVLVLRDQVENDRLNIGRLEDAFALTKVLVQGGQVSQIQQDQAEQDVLNARLRLEGSQTEYQSVLDRFKITLGLPVSTNVEVNYPEALDSLRKAGPAPLSLDEQQAVEEALMSHTTLLAARSGVRDADRDVLIAADRFLPQLDLMLGSSVPSTPLAQPGRLQAHRHTRWARLIFNYQIDQTDNRNAYRNAMITASRLRRVRQESEDTVRLNIRNSFRRLDRSRRSYLLQVQNLSIAKRRTRLARLQQKDGQASTRDVLEAEESLRNAMNGLTSSLVRYTTTRLEFLADMGLLEINPAGDIIERTEPFGFQRLCKKYPYLVSENDRQGESYE